MGTQNEGHEATTRVLEAQTHGWNHVLSLINSLSLKSAIELNIPDIIHKHGKPMPLSLLASSLQIHPSKAPNLRRLMRFLTHTGFFSLQKLPETSGPLEEDGYVLTDTSTLFLKDHPFTLTPFLLSMLDPLMMKPWDHFPTWLQNDDPTPFETANGKAFYDYAWHVPKLFNYFRDYMAGDSQLVSKVLVEQCRDVFKGCGSLVDVGGNTGTMTKALAEAFPEMECTVFDSPYVIGDMKGCGNLRFVKGDMFQAIPPADVILMKWILCDWDDERCLKILKNCKEAVTSKGKRGKLVIINEVVEDEKGDYESVETQLQFDLLLMAVLPGKERNEKEWAQLISSAGFSTYKIIPVLGLRSLVEVYP
ncbi:probable O-methyltransferase 3 [Neltuma alba]|uniref:probable O-methyltransferase 3 n=1 Tax=Neltuma alba TaxID=207710 RepID=UPI0010A3A7B5|nr:probable O-methyltransferase 3 [Prosopis alba]